MNIRCFRESGPGCRYLAAIAAAGALAAMPLFSQVDDDKEEDEVYELSPFITGGSPSATSTLSGTRIRTQLGATAGGAQDIRLTRDLVARGLIPPSSSFTPEGLFSEHDLPIDGVAQPGFLFDVAAQAAVFESAAQPEVEVLAQLGFVSGIDAAEFRPRPLNLVAVVDKSGSMSGHPLDLVCRSLRQLVGQMGSDDQLTIVLYGSTTHIHLPTTATEEANKDAILRSIDGIVSSGSTYMEAGLKLGFETARATSRAFDGATRVMLFTDEQPNVGRVDAGSFMGMAESASLDGIGLTTIGVGVHFGAELAEKVSSARGGNLFFFDGAESMEKTFRQELDTMTLELAYDMELTIHPASGARIAGLYGIPGDMVEWNEDGSLSLGIATIFASRNKGAIYFGLAAKDGQPPLSQRAKGESLARVSLSYIQSDNAVERASEISVTLAQDPPMEGLLKGSYLVDQYASFKLATCLYERGEYAAAAEVAAAFARRPLPMEDAALAKERALATELSQKLADDARLRGAGRYVSETPRLRGKAALVGEWVETGAEPAGGEREMLRFNDDGTAELFATSEANPLRFIDESGFRATWRNIVFKDWGQTLRYSVRDGHLELERGDGATRYERRPSETELQLHASLRALQREVSGLPAEPQKELASAR